MSELEIPESWAEQSLGELCEGFQYGINASAQQEGSYHLLRITDLKESDINWHVVPKVNIEEGEADKYLLGDGDIVIARSGSIGKSAIIKNAPENAVFASYLIRVKIKEFVKSWPIFKFYFNAPIFQDHLRKNAKGATQQNINTEVLKRSPLVVLPVSEQRRIVAKIESTFKRIEAIEKAVETAESLLTKYRESLLNKAFRGKLVPQDPDDEPASKLLERIRAERAKQQDGRKKKRDELPTITEEEIPFEIPKSWEWVRLGSVSTVFNGATPSRQKKEYWGGTINWVSSGEVKNNLITETREQITEIGFQNAAVRLCPPGTVLVAMIGQGKTRGKTSILGIEATTNQNIACIEISHGLLDSRYVWEWFQYQYEHNRTLGFGTEQKALNCRIVSEMLIALPPLAEQKLIVAVLASTASKTKPVFGQFTKIRGTISKLRHGVLRTAFSGRLVPQDPSEGTGHELLEQILAAKSNSDASQPVKSPPKR